MRGSRELTRVQRARKLLALSQPLEHHRHRETMRKKNYGAESTRFETGYDDLGPL